MPIPILIKIYRNLILSPHFKWGVEVEWTNYFDFHLDLSERGFIFEDMKNKFKSVLAGIALFIISCTNNAPVPTFKTRMGYSSTSGVEAILDYSVNSVEYYTVSLVIVVGNTIFTDTGLSITVNEGFYGTAFWFYEVNRFGVVTEKHFIA